MRKKKQVNRLISSMIFSLVAMSALSQTAAGRPTLVVGITIDQLRSDYIDLLQSHFGNNGFKRLMREGVYLENLTFDISKFDKLTTTALLYTGAYPNINGIISSERYEESDHRRYKVLTDTKYIGNASNETLSPMALKVSTLSDELRMDNNGIGEVYAIAPDAQQAIIMAGHAANGAFWIDDKTGKWASTTFYKDYPTVVSNRNFSQSLTSKLDTIQWKPILNVNDYPGIALHRTLFPFKYTFAGENRVEKFKQSALVNEEITEVAIDCIDELTLGKRAGVDMLNIAYTVSPIDYAFDADSRIELQDKYIRLDRDLARLFAAIDRQVGRNVCIFVTSTGYFSDSYAPEARFNIPTGEFSSKKAVSLLNMYLMALYGTGSWVSGYYDQTVYLNEALAKEQNISVEELRDKSGKFLRRMAGVCNAYTLDEIIDNPTSDDLRRLHKTITTDYAGDVFLQITPGWKVVDDYNTNLKDTYSINNAVSAPCFIIAPNIEPKKIITPVDATILAPTVSRILRIRSPNAAKELPLNL